MKKFLSFLIFIFAVVLLQAQQPAKVATDLSQPQIMKYTHITGLEQTDEVITPTLLRNGSGKFIGSTKY